MMPSSTGWVQSMVNLRDSLKSWLFMMPSSTGWVQSMVNLRDSLFFLPPAPLPRQAEAEGQGCRWQEEQAVPQVHHRLHPPRRGRHHEQPGLREVPQREDQGWRQDQQLWQGGGSGQGEEQDLLDLHHRLLQEVPQVSYQEVLEEEQLEGLAACGRQRQGLLRAPLLPDQQRG